MKDPTTKPDLLARMEEGHRELHAVLSRIPDERMAEIALYDNWTIKDFIAHIGAWEQATADRIATVRQGQKPPVITKDMLDGINAEFHARYRDMPLNDVRAMEAAAFAAMQRQVNEATDAELFDPTYFPGRTTALRAVVAGDTYEHYAEHLDDVRAWIRS